MTYTGGLDVRVDEASQCKSVLQRPDAGLHERCAVTMPHFKKQVSNRAPKRPGGVPKPPAQFSARASKHVTLAPQAIKHTRAHGQHRAVRRQGFGVGSLLKPEQRLQPHLEHVVLAPQAVEHARAHDQHRAVRRQGLNLGSSVGVFWNLSSG